MKKVDLDNIRVCYKPGTDYKVDFFFERNGNRNSIIYDPEGQFHKGETVSAFHSKILTLPEIVAYRLLGILKI